MEYLHSPINFCYDYSYDLPSVLLKYRKYEKHELFNSLYQTDKTSFYNLLYRKRRR